MNISEKKIVTVTYDLYVGEEEELMEQATKEQPLTFCFGIGMMLEEFEKNLVGKKTGDKFDFKIDHTLAHGEYDDNKVMELDKSIFEKDGKFDSETIFEGNIISLMDNHGGTHNAAILEVTKDKVKVDLNNPMAGEDMHFVGEVLEVREATEQELEMIMNPGCGGGCGGGCSCGDDCGDDCGHQH